MSTLLAAIKLVLGDIAALGSAGNAALVSALAAGIVAIVAAVFGATLTTAEVAGWIALAASVAALIEKITTGQAAAAKK